jgi:tetrahedral aminopeptidase
MYSAKEHLMDKAEIEQILRRLAGADGPSGQETRAQKVAQELCGPYVTEVRLDALGNMIAHRPGSASDQSRSSIMLAAHLDEIGLMVTKVEGSFLHLARIGGIDPRTLLCQEVTVYPSGEGSERYPDGLSGYIGARPPHVLSQEDRGKLIPLSDLRADLGFPVDGLVRVGDRVTVFGPYTELLGGRVASKAFDNRASVAAMIGALGYLAQTQHSWDVYAVATSQEETGLQGAPTVAYRLAPDIALAVDVTFAETPGVDDSDTVPWNQGPAICWGPNFHPGIVKRLRETADALEIPYVDELEPGPSGTDAWGIQIVREGIPCGLVSIPVRYMHSSVETLVVADVDRTARLLAAFISRLDDTFLAGLPEEV